MWDPVPFAIGGDSLQSPESGRTLAYLALNGHEGVVDPADLKVVPLDVPGAGVNVTPGVGGILNKIQSRQAYVSRNPTVDPVQIAQTGSASGRADMVVARVQNPYVDDNAPDPADPQVGPFMFSDVIEGVPASARTLDDVPDHAGDSAIPLALITLPKNTATVTADMILDLRQLANPLSSRLTLRGTMTDKTYTVDGTYQDLPVNPIDGFLIPPWATHAVIRMDLMLRYVDGSPKAELMCYLTTGSRDATTMWADVIIDPSQTGGSARIPYSIPSNGLFVIPPAMRGKVAKLTSRIKGVDVGGRLATSTADYYNGDVTFMQALL